MAGRPLDAGRLDQRITIQQRAAAKDALGQSHDWEDVATVWAQAEPLRGREWFAAGQVQSQADVRFRIRYRADLTTAHRILWRSLPHDIVALADVDGGQHTTELLASTGIRDGIA